MKQMGEDLAGTDDVVAVYITENAPSLFDDVRYQRLYRRCSNAVAVELRQIDRGARRGRPMAYRLVRREIASISDGNAEAARAGRDADHRAELGQVAEQDVSAWESPVSLGRGWICGPLDKEVRP